MAGIVFWKTNNLDEIEAFYSQVPGMTLWLRQADCIVWQHQNMLLGFCQREQADTGGMITLFYNTVAEVDAMYSRYRHIATSKPQQNEKYGIYQFFATDPDGRALEFQAFLHPTMPWQDGGSLLRRRRSTRRYKPEPPPREVLEEVFELCRYAPTARNTQGYYILVFRDERAELAAQRPGSGDPILAAPLAVAVVANADRSPRPVEDGDIAATYLMLAAWQCGLGTCWIGGMNTDAVKDILGVPHHHYVAMVSPIGWPDEHKELPTRREIDEFVTWRCDG